MFFSFFSFLAFFLVTTKSSSMPSPPSPSSPPKLKTLMSLLPFRSFFRFLPPLPPPTPSNFFRSKTLRSSSFSVIDTNLWSFVGSSITSNPLTPILSSSGHTRPLPSVKSKSSLPSRTALKTVPPTTLPKMTCLPSSHAVSRRVMKNSPAAVLSEGSLLPVGVNVFARAT